MVTLFAVEALITTAIRGNWPDDDDEDGILDDLAMLTAEETFFGVIGGIPGFGSVSGSLRGYGSGGIVASFRSEEHTSELQSLMRTSYAVFCLKKKKKAINHATSYNHAKTT